MQRRAPAFFALIALGVVLLIAGIVYGLGSRQVQYRGVPQGSIAHYLSADGTGYLQMEGNPALYIVHQDNFSPKLPTFADSDIVTFVYDPGETTAVDEKSTIGTHLVGTASKVVSITTVDAAGQKTYKTPEFVSNPRGYDHNQWPIGIGLFVVGLLLIGGSFFLPKKKLSEMTTPPAIPSYPMTGQQQGAYWQNTPPNGQQLQQGYPSPYAPTQPNYPPQQGPYQQPSSSNHPQQPYTQFGQLQQPSPYSQPQQQQQQNPYGQPQQQQPSSPSGGLFIRPNQFQPPQQ